MTSHSHYAAQQAAASEIPAPGKPVGPRPKNRFGKETVGNFTGMWKADKWSQFNACLVNGDETRCTLGPRRPIWGRPARSADKCSRCMNPAYCPDCGDTTVTPHRADCIYDGQR